MCKIIKTKECFLLLFAVLSSFVRFDAALAQIVPDSTLGNNNSRFVRGQGTSPGLVEGGQKSGSNLFHSFQEFNVRDGSSVYFENPDGVRSIISRVTGANPSSIRGILGVNGSADLFLINSNGLLFGPNSRLDIGGSFIATTARLLRFDDGLFYSTSNDSVLSDLSTGMPSALVFNSSVSPIDVLGNGHTLLISSSVGSRSIETPIFLVDEPDANLAVSEGEFIGLFAGSISSVGGIVSAPSGDVSIGAVRSGSVFINYENQKIDSVEYSQFVDYGDINLSRQAMVDTSGNQAGQIDINARNIGTRDNSIIINQYSGSASSGQINLTASNDISISGDSEFTPNQPIVFPFPPSLTRGVTSEVYGSGTGADINIQSNTLTLENSARVQSAVFSEGIGGSIDIDVSDSVQILGTSPVNPTTVGSFVTASSINSGKTGKININSSKLTILDGAFVASVAFNTSQGDDVSIFSDEILVSGVTGTINLNPSRIGSTNFSNGEGGDLSINAGKIFVTNGGLIDAASTAEGDAGNLDISAKHIEVSGRFGDTPVFSEINASALLLNPIIRQGLSLPDIPTGLSGEVNIKADSLKVADGARINVGNDGPNDAGSLNIESNSLIVDEGFITASTNGGDGGSIFIDASGISLFGDSQISTSALNDGLGGDINIQSNQLVLFDDSSISANAENAFGGNISINSRAFILSPFAFISATSAQGPNFDGSFEVSTISNDLSRDSKPQSPPIVLPKIEKICNVGSSTSDERFSIVDGVNEPLHPDDSTNRMIAWYAKKQDQAEGEPLSYVLKTTGEVRQYKRMVGWTEKSNGRIALTSDPNKAVQYQASKPKNCLKANRG